MDKMKPEVIIGVSVVAILVVVGLYFFLKKEKYTGKKLPESAMISLSMDAENIVGTDQFKTSIKNLLGVLGNIMIGVAGPSTFIPSGYNGAFIVYYSDGTKEIKPFGKTVAVAGNDLAQMYKQF